MLGRTAAGFGMLGLAGMFGRSGGTEFRQGRAHVFEQRSGFLLGRREQRGAQCRPGDVERSKGLADLAGRIGRCRSGLGHPR